MSALSPASQNARRVLQTVARLTRAPVFRLAANRLSAQTWRSMPSPTSKAASASRCRVGLSPPAHQAFGAAFPCLQCHGTIRFRGIDP